MQLTWERRAGDWTTTHPTAGTVTLVRRRDGWWITQRAPRMTRESPIGVCGVGEAKARAADLLVSWWPR